MCPHITIFDVQEKHLEYKKHKFNELHEEVLAKEKQVQKLQNHAVESMLRVPEEMEQEQAAISKLKQEMRSLEDELVEAEAKNRLYTLLGERTRREHMSMEKKVREAREMKEDCLEDHAALTSHMHDMRAAKEESEKKLAQMRAQYQQGKMDWERKLTLRKKEVVELKKRQEREKEKEERKTTKLREKEEKERRIQAEQEMQMEAYELQCAALAPKIEAMEASWNRLRSISGAQTTEDVIGYFFSLRSKEENMRELVAQAEKREAKAKTTLGEMLDARSEMFESAMAGQDGTFEEHKSRIDDAERRLAQAKKRFNRLRQVCISAEQGVRFLLARLMVAFEEPIEDEGMQSMLDNAAKGAPGPIKAPEGDADDDAEPNEAELNRIDDVSFFPGLLDYMSRVANRLNKMLAIEEQYKTAPPPPPVVEPEPEPEPEPVAATDAEGEQEGAEPEAEASADPAAEPEAPAEGEGEAAAAEGEAEPEAAAEGEAPAEGAEEAAADEAATADDAAAADAPAPEGEEASAEAKPEETSAEGISAEAPKEEAAAAPAFTSVPSPKMTATFIPEPAESDTTEDLPKEDMEKRMKEQETKLQKGMKRTEWCGPAWVETVSGSPIMPGADATKRKKGKKKKDQPQPDLTRILGYAGSDVEEEEEEDDEDEEGDEEEWDGFVDRDFIKHRSMKMTYKAQAMAQGR